MTIPEHDEPDEIEVTPEMIEAGVDEWARYDNKFGPGRDEAMVRKFKAMVAAAPNPVKASPPESRTCPTCGQPVRPLTGAERQRAYRKRRECPDYA